MYGVLAEFIIIGEEEFSTSIRSFIWPLKSGYSYTIVGYHILRPCSDHSIEVSRKESGKKKSRHRGSSEEGRTDGLKGRIKIVTRCLWVDRGKLLDALHKAASAALSSLKLDSTLGTVEHTVGVALRKVVQKYSNRRPDVIIIATESSVSDRPESVKTEGPNGSNGGVAPRKNTVNSINDKHFDNAVSAKLFQSINSAPSKVAISMAGGSLFSQHIFL